MIERLRTVEQMLMELSRRLAASEATVAGLSQALWQTSRGGNAPQDDDTLALFATGVVTTEITKATSATVPGEGEFQRYASFDATGPELADLTGTDEAIFSIDLDYKIVVDAVVHAIRWKGSWWVVMVDSCTSLDDT